MRRGWAIIINVAGREEDVVGLLWLELLSSTEAGLVRKAVVFSWRRKRTCNKIFKFKRV
jgi:hypothetical protein